MEWFAAFGLAGVVVLVLRKFNKIEGGAKNSAMRQGTETENRDDLSNASVGAFFILDEVVDQPISSSLPLSTEELVFDEDILFFDADDDCVLFD